MSKTPGIPLTPEQLEIVRKLGKIGGQTRAKNLTAAQRKSIAQKAAKASAEVRSRLAKARDQC